MMSIEVLEEADSQWNQRLIKSGFGTIYQSREIASNFRKRDYTPLFLRFIDNKGSITGQLLCYLHPILKNNNLRSKILTKIPSARKLFCRWSYGPIIFEPSSRTIIYETLGKFLLKKKYRIQGSEHPLCSGPLNSLKNNFEISLWSTYLIDLTIPKDQLYNNIKKSNGRKNIERSIRKGVVVEEITTKTLPEYVDVLNKMYRESGREEVKLDIIMDWWTLFEPLGYSGLIAKKNETIIGGLLFSYFNNYLIEALVARSKKDSEEKLYAQDLIKWKIIEWANNKKLRYYDLAGFNPKPESPKEVGIMEFKKKWGGVKHDFWKIKKTSFF